MPCLHDSVIFQHVMASSVKLSSKVQLLDSVLHSLNDPWRDTTDDTFEVALFPTDAEGQVLSWIHLHRNHSSSVSLAEVVEEWVVTKAILA